MTALQGAEDLEMIVGETFPLDAAAAAHQYVEGRKRSGKVVLLP